MYTLGHIETKRHITIHASTRLNIEMTWNGYRNFDVTMLLSWMKPLHDVINKHMAYIIDFKQAIIIY